MAGRPSTDTGTGTTNHVDADIVSRMRLPVEGFDWTAISNYFQISRQALTRRLVEFQFVETLLSVSDAVVDEVVLQYLQEGR